MLLWMQIVQWSVYLWTQLYDFVRPNVIALLFVILFVTAAVLIMKYPGSKV